MCSCSACFWCTTVTLHYAGALTELGCSDSGIEVFFHCESKNKTINSTQIIVDCKNFILKPKEEETDE